VQHDGERARGSKMMTTKFTDAELMAYVDGEVDDEKALAIEAAATADPDVARTIDMFARTRMMARDAFSPASRETLPPKLLASALGRPAQEEPAVPPGNVMPFRLRRPSFFAAGMAAAACLAMIAAGVAGYVAGSRLDGMGGRIELAAASDEVSGLLQRLPAGEQATLQDGSSIQVIGSFRDGNDRFCREFEVSGKSSGSLAVACRTGSSWAIEFAMQMTAAAGYEPASATAVIDSYLAQIGAGAVLSTDDERALLDQIRSSQ
jgi:hypothetical protein